MQKKFISSKLALAKGARAANSQTRAKTHLSNDADIRDPIVIDESIYKEKIRAEIALNSISDAVICTDINGNIDYLNIAAEKITGWTRQEANGHPINEVFKIINGTTRIFSL